MGSYTKLTYHIVFATKYRHAWISRDIQLRLYDYMGGIIRGLKGHAIQIGGVDDHVHLLAQLSPTIALADAIRDIKANSSKWISEISPTHREFEWQRGYGAFTVGHSQVESVKAYIQNQAQHHQSQSFQDEYLAFLNRHGIEFRMEYLFEDEIHV